MIDAYLMKIIGEGILGGMVIMVVAKLVLVWLGLL